ncbi:MAG: NAD-dependent protein deacylase [Pseudomonadota bacterium]|nr:NAD-dependent protein deacylase [Pseudomonadota bacterium]
MTSAAAGTADELVGRAAEALRRARHVCVLTGAGISAESGIPTFRDALTGLWAKFSPEELATPEAFERDPETVWSWYEWRRQLIRQAQPNAGHLALAELARRVPRLTLVTQNVDGLHQRAGSPGVLEYHGNILRDRCTVEQIVANRSEDTRRAGLPRCAACGGLLRPDVVWFGEAIPAGPMALAAAAAEDCDVFLSVGTSSLVYPAAGLAEVALRRRATLIEINPNATDLSPHADLVLAGPSGQVLPALLQAMS